MEERRYFGRGSIAVVVAIVVAVIAIFVDVVVVVVVGGECRGHDGPVVVPHQWRRFELGMAARGVDE